MTDRLLLSFRPDGPRRPPQARWKWLHWPALAFRVRAQVPPARQLDVFEELVLRLGLSGYQSPDMISELSGLAPDLVTLIIGQLAQRGLIDSRGPTALGRAAVDKEARDDTTESVLGFMLRCQISGQVMPLFCEGELPVRKPQGFPPINLPAIAPGSDAGPQRDFHLAMRHWRELLQVADHRDRSDEEYDAQSFPLDADETTPAPAGLEAGPNPMLSGSADPPMRLNENLTWSAQQVALELIDGPAQPVAVRVLMYLPAVPRSIAPAIRNEEASLDGVLLRHPFGIPGGDWYRHRLAARLPELGATAGEVRAWAKGVREQRSKELHNAGITIADLGSLGRQRASDLFGEVELLEQALAPSMAGLGQALLLTEKRAAPPDELRMQTTKVLEIICDAWICRFGSHREAPAKWAGTYAGRKASIRAAAQRLGISSIPLAMRDPDCDGLTRAVAGQGNLRDRLVLVLVDAATAPALLHPFALALRREPTLLADLDELRSTRNRSAHFRRGQSPQNPQDSTAVARVVELVQRCLGAMFSAWRDALQPVEASIPLDL